MKDPMMTGRKRRGTMKGSEMEMPMSRGRREAGMPRMGIEPPGEMAASPRMRMARETMGTSAPVAMKKGGMAKKTMAMKKGGMAKKGMKGGGMMLVIGIGKKKKGK